MSSYFSDDRGSIQDLVLGDIDAVTRIFTRQGAIRGNHYHERTTQWTYIVSGTLLIADRSGQRQLHPGQMWIDQPGEAHAWKALTDANCIVITRGPRSGEGYESDTVRLEEPLL